MDYATRGARLSPRILKSRRRLIYFDWLRASGKARIEHVASEDRRRWRLETAARCCREELRERGLLPW